jgi:hypothetical protein
MENEKLIFKRLSLEYQFILWFGIFCFYVYTLIWGIHWHDVGEWISSPWVLAPAHPPSHPIAISWIHAIEHGVFLGDIAWRGNLSSALAMSVAFLFSIKTLALWLPQHPWLRILLSVWIYVLPLCWLQAIRAEVYAIQQMLSAMILWSLSHYQLKKDQRFLLLSAFFIGLIGTNHTLLSLCLGIPVLCWLCLTQRLGVKKYLLSLPVIALGLFPYMLVWARGKKGGIWGWPWIENLSDFWDNLMAKIWSKQVEKQNMNLDIQENINALIKAMIDELGLISFFSLLLIFALSSTKWVFQKYAQERQMPQSFALLLVGNIILVLSTNFLYAYNPINPDLSGYFCASLPAFLLLIAMSLLLLKPMIKAILLALILLGYQGYDLHHRQECRTAEVWHKMYSETLPSRSILMNSFYSNYFNLIALQLIEGWRTDLNYLFRGQRWDNAYWRRQDTDLRELQDTQRWLVFKRPIFFETESVVDQEYQYWPKLYATGLSFLLQSPMVDHHHFTFLSIDELQLKLQHARLLFSKENAMTLDLDSTYHFTFFEMEQRRYLSEILPYLPLTQRHLIHQQIIFFDQEAQKWLKNIDE